MLHRDLIGVVTLRRKSWIDASGVGAEQLSFYPFRKNADLHVDCAAPDGCRHRQRGGHTTSRQTICKLQAMQQLSLTAQITLVLNQYRLQASSETLTLTPAEVQDRYARCVLTLESEMNVATRQAVAKVPEVTLLFWIIKIAATTLGETGGDAVSMSMNLGYLVSTGIFAVIFIIVVAVQIAANRFHPYVYWATIIATTTLGTTLADFVTRSLGIGYLGGSSILLALLLASLALWHRVMGTVSGDSVSTPRSEMFYWMTIMFSQTLGTALGDWTADTAGLGYLGAAAIFGGLLILVACAYFWTRISHTALFWTAFVLTRPLGAVLGDFLDKPIASGGLALSRYNASLVLLVFIVGCLVIFKQKPASRNH